MPVLAGFSNSIVPMVVELIIWSAAAHPHLAQLEVGQDFQKSTFLTCSDTSATGLRKSPEEKSWKRPCSLTVDTNCSEI
eukprot:6456217-Amphidinium_carterae.2